MKAKGILNNAAGLVSGDRNSQHGEIPETFNHIAIMWSAWLQIRKNPSAALDAHDVAQMMALMKKARTQSGTHNLDDYIDDAGYSAIAGEVSE